MKNSSIDKEDMPAEQAEPLYFIDLDWYQQNNCSFTTLAQGCLCPKCQKQLKAEGGEISTADLLAAIGDCCSKKSDFITRELPILASVFRLFLANGTHPLDLEELGKQLSECRGGDIYCTSTEILSRLLANERYYGLRQVPD